MTYQEPNGQNIWGPPPVNHFKDTLQRVVLNAHRLRLIVQTGTVQNQKHSGDAIKFQPAISVIDSVDVASYDASGARELDAVNNEERRQALGQDGNQTIWEIMPLQCLHTKALLERYADCAYNVTG